MAGKLEKVVVPDAQQPQHDRHVAVQRRGAEMVVHGVIAVEHAEEILRPDGDHQRQPDRRRQAVAAADPVPEREHVPLGVDSESGDQFRTGRERDEMLGNGRLVFHRLEQPALGAFRVGHRLLGRERLAGDDEQRFRRVEIAGGLRQVGSVDVRDETHGQSPVGKRPQGLAGHRRPQVRSADAHVDDILDLLAGVPGPLAAADSPCEAGHLVEHRADARHDVLAIDVDRFVGAIAQGRVQYGSILGGVDLLAGEHPLDRAGQVDRFGQGDEQPHGLVGDPVLRIVEPQPARLDHEPIRAARVFAKKVGQVQRLDGNEVLFEILPGRLLVESHHDRLCFPSGQRFGSPEKHEG